MASRTTLADFRDAIVEAVAELDQADGSRIGLSEAIDSARNVLQTAYGDDLDGDVQVFLDSQEGESADDEEDDEDDDEDA